MTQPAVTPVGEDILRTESDLRRIYKLPSTGAVVKNLSYVDRHAQRFIELSPFVCVGTTDVEGRGDVTPRGGDPGFVRVLDPTHLAIPDRPGNNRIDSLTNIVQRPGVGMLFFVPGFEDTLRLNGLAYITTEASLMRQFIAHGKMPLSVVIIEVKEVYLHCGKALRRSGLWKAGSQVDRHTYPTVGQIYRDQMKLEMDPAKLDVVFEKDVSENLY